uniref:hypothetical protein n=1 Tax=Mycobacterium tuberculosis TaxID=1773 RepID=UPI00214E66E3
LPLEAQMVMAPSIKRPPAKESGVRVTLGQDEPGCKDSALMPRIAGCTIIQCDLKDDEALEFQTAVSKTGEPLHDAVEGQAEILFYLCPGSLGTNGIMKSTVESLGRNSFRTIFNGKDEADFPIVTAWKDRQWIQVSTYSYFEDVVYVQS